MELLIRSASGQLAVIALLKAASPVWTRLRVGSGGCEKGVKESESQTKFRHFDPRWRMMNLFQ